MFLAISLIVTLTANAASVSLLKEVVLNLYDSGYQKIENTQVPVNILRNVSSKYSGYVLNESFSSGNGVFKLTLDKAGKTVFVYYKSTGEFIKQQAKYA